MSKLKLVRGAQSIVANGNKYEVDGVDGGVVVMEILEPLEHPFELVLKPWAANKVEGVQVGEEEYTFLFKVEIANNQAKISSTEDAAQVLRKGADLVIIDYYR